MITESWSVFIVTLQKTFTEVGSLAVSMVPTKNQLVQWLILHQREWMFFGCVIHRIILAFFAILFTIYIVIPTKSNLTVSIRLICVVLLLAAIAFSDYMLAIRVFISCAIFGVLLHLLKSTLIDMSDYSYTLMHRWYSIKRIIARKNEKME